MRVRGGEMGRRVHTSDTSAEQLLQAHVFTVGICERLTEHFHNIFPVDVLHPQIRRHCGTFPSSSIINTLLSINSPPHIEFGAEPKSIQFG